jgi:hypothetical protein
MASRHGAPWRNEYVGGQVDACAQCGGVHPTWPGGEGAAGGVISSFGCIIFV